MAFDPASSSPKPVFQGSWLNLLKNYGPRFYRFHWKLGKMGGYETINRRYGSFILRLKILVITADLFYTDTLVFGYSKKFCTKQLLWSCDRLREAITEAWNLCWRMGNCSSPLPSDFAHYTVLSNFWGNYYLITFTGCLWTVPPHLQYQKGKWVAAKSSSCSMKMPVKRLLVDWTTSF